jgi:hypothetical protein
MDEIMTIEEVAKYSNNLHVGSEWKDPGREIGQRMEVQKNSY